MPQRWKRQLHCWNAQRFSHKGKGKTRKLSEAGKDIRAARQKVQKLRKKKLSKATKKKLRKLEKKLSKKRTEKLKTDQALLNCEDEESGFAGPAASLSPYREALTDSEIDYLLNKVAFGGSPELKKIGREQGLSALVDALVDGVMSNAQLAELQTDALYWADQFEWTPNESPNKRVWTYPAVQAGEMYRLIKTRNPFQEWMVLALMGHFAINLDQIGFSYSEYAHAGLPEFWNLLLTHRVGNLESLANDLLLDPAMNEWLDNKDNNADAPNQNFARELLELFLLGAVDPVTGEPNYGEDSIVAATGFVSGYYEDITSDPYNSGSTVMDIQFNSSLRDGSARTVFADIPGAEITDSLSAQEFISHILYKHPGSSRYLAERFSGMLLYPGLEEDMVQDLAHTLREEKYELAPMLKRVLKSEAMFSKKSQQSCLQAPLEHFTRLARRLFPDELPRANQSEAENSSWLIMTVVNAASSAGQELFGPPSVFSWKGSCNINRNGAKAAGEGWISAQYLLNRNNACGDIVNNLNWREIDWLDATGLKISTPVEDIASTVAKNIFDLSLSSTERELLTNYLNYFLGEGGPVQGFTFPIDQDWAVRMKIPQLICLIAEIYDSNAR